MIFGSRRLVNMILICYQYSYDITLIASSRESISDILQIYEQYATKHDILFNPVKSHCMFFCKCSKKPYSVYFKHNCINFVDLLSGIKMSRDSRDRHISSAVHSSYRKSNEVLLDFAAVTSDVKSSLFST